MSALATSIHNVVEVLASTITRKGKDIQIRKEEVKLSIFADNMVL